MLGSYSSILVPNWISDMFKYPWKFLGFVSSTVGLICYALSPSFPRLYGEWNILKITLYVLVSLIISWIMLFVENLRDWAFLRLKAHVVFLVLMLASSYSVFYDKTLDGKPDTLNVISNGAFALMSRQIELGFESGMSNFFLGCLTVQLMKINLMLTSAAVVFCYLVVVVLSHLDSQSQVEVDHVIANDHLSIQIDVINRVAEGADIDMDIAKEGPKIEMDTVRGAAREGADIEMDTVRGAAVEGAEIEMDTVRGATGEGAEIEMDAAKRVAGDGAHDVSEIEESYATGTTEKVLTNAMEESNGSVTYDPALSKPFKRKKGIGLKAVLKADISNDRVKRKTIRAVKGLSGSKSLSDAMTKATRFAKKVKVTLCKR